MYNEEMEDEESYVTLNWDKLVRNSAIWEVIKEELDDIEAESLMKIITVAKEQGLKDAQIFNPIMPEEEVEYEDLKEGSIEDSTKD